MKKKTLYTKINSQLLKLKQQLCLCTHKNRLQVFSVACLPHFVKYSPKLCYPLQASAQTHSFILSRLPHLLHSQEEVHQTQFHQAAQRVFPFLAHILKAHPTCSRGCLSQLCWQIRVALLSVQEMSTHLCSQAHPKYCLKDLTPPTNFSLACMCLNFLKL